MSSHTEIPQFSRMEIVETGRRRRWSLEEKRRIVVESHIGFQQVSATARRNGISNSLLSTWRKAEREGRLGGDEAFGFVPARIGSGPVPAGVPVAAGRMEVVGADGRRIIVGPDVDAEALRRVLEALERR